MLDKKTAAHLKSIFESGYHWKRLAGQMVEILGEGAEMDTVDELKGVCVRAVGCYLCYDFDAEIDMESEEVE